MPRRYIDPADGVIQYFESAELSAAQTTLAIAAGVVKRRQGPKAAPAVKKKPERRREETQTDGKVSTHE